MQREKLWTPEFLGMGGSNLFLFMSQYIMVASLPIFIMDTLGGGDMEAGLAMTAFQIGAVSCRPLAGRIIDAVNKQRLMRAATIAFFLVMLAFNWLHSEQAIYALRFLHGCIFALATTAAAAMAALVLPASRKGEGIGYYGLGQALAMSIGPAFALWLVSTDPAENIFFGLAAVAAVGLAFSFTIRYERHPQSLPAGSAYRRRIEQGRAPGAEAGREALGLRRLFEPRALAGAIPMCVLSPVYGYAIFFSGLFGTTLGVGNAGLFFTFSALVMLVLRALSGTFMDRVRPLFILLVAVAGGMVAFSIQLLIAGWAPSPATSALYYLSGGFYGVFIGLSQPLNQSVAVKNTPPERWGAANALVLLALDVGCGVGAAALGAVNDRLGFGATLVIVLCFLMAGLATAAKTYPRPERR